MEFTRKVCPYIVNDDLCPFCNVKLISHNIFYQEKNNGVICDKSIKWHKCPNCKKLFALDHDIIDFNSTNTNVEFNTKYYNKVLFHDTIVIFNINKCSSHNHEIEDLTCELPIIKSNGEVEYTSVPIIYCKTCKRYIMLKSVYDGLNGVPACIIINETRNKNDYTENDFQHGDNGGSKLYQYGYNVNCNDNLTVEQRHTILSMQLLSNNLTKGEICSTLDTNINNGLKRKSSKRDWSNAVSKWKADKEFVQKINLERENEKININKLILKFTEVKS